MFSAIYSTDICSEGVYSACVDPCKYNVSTTIQPVCERCLHYFDRIETMMIIILHVLNQPHCTIEYSSLIVINLNLGKSRGST